MSSSVGIGSGGMAAGAFYERRQQALERCKRGKVEQHRNIAGDIALTDREVDETEEHRVVNLRRRFHVEKFGAGAMQDLRQGDFQGALEIFRDRRVAGLREYVAG